MCVCKVKWLMVFIKIYYSSHSPFCMMRILKKSSFRSGQECNTLLLSIITILQNRPPELIPINIHFQY